MFHLKNENLERFVNYQNENSNYKNSYFSGMWKFCDPSLHKSRIYPTLSSFFVFLFFHFQCLSRYMCGHNLAMKVPPDFSNCTGLNGFVNSFSQFTCTPPNKLILLCKHYWSAKRKKTASCEKVVARRCSAKKLS